MRSVLAFGRIPVQPPQSVKPALLPNDAWIADPASLSSAFVGLRCLAWGAQGPVWAVRPMTPALGLCIRKTATQDCVLDVSAVRRK